VEAILAHKQHGIAAVYNRASFREGKSAALAHWSEIVMKDIASENEE
jgi:hypothetical protein